LANKPQQKPYDGSMTQHIRNTMQALIALIGMTALAGPEHNSLPDGLQAHWTFEDCKLLEQNRAFTLQADKSTNCAPGKVGQAWVFDGVQSSNHLKTSITTNSKQGYAINLWFQLSSDQSMDGDRQASEFGAQALFGKPDDRNGLNVRLERSKRDGSWFVYAGNGRCCDPKRNRVFGVESDRDGIRPGSWHMLSVNLDAKRNLMMLYLDGELRAQKPTGEFDLNPKGDQEPLYLGIMGAAGWYPLNGMIDEVRVYSRPLLSGEVARLYTLEGVKN
jgi:Concanavalin A-like lectin/glucanases superfamily